MSNDLVQGFKDSTKKTNQDKRPYVLNEVLCIMAMFKSGLKPKQVSELTGRSVHTLRYKFLEGEIELNGVKTIRSVKRFNSTSEIFAHYKTDWVSDDDVAQRIQSYKDSLTSTTTEETQEAAS